VDVSTKVCANFERGKQSFECFAQKDLAGSSSHPF